MGIFRRRQDAPQVTSPPYQPIVDMRTAKPAVFTLAHAMGLNDTEVRAAIANFAQLSGRPRLEEILPTMRDDSDAPNRPWIWLAAVMRQAGKSGDHALAVAALFWSAYWTATLVPKIGDTWLAFVEQDINLDPIPPALKKEILTLGLASASQLPDDLIIAEDATGAARVGWIAATAETFLGL
jgi:hypothetical protein